MHSRFEKSEMRRDLPFKKGAVTSTSKKTGGKENG
jgi:hypothetical protein